MAVTELRGIDAAGVTRSFLDFMMSMQSKKERKRVAKREEEELEMKKEAFGITKQQATADLLLKEMERQIAATRLPTEQAKMKEAKMRVKKLKELRKSDPKMYSDYLLGGVYSKALRDQLAIMGTERNMLMTQISSLGQTLAGERFQYQQDKDATNRLFNLFLGPGAEDMKKALGDEAFDAAQTAAISEMAGERRRMTPHDAGIFNVLKKPRDPLDFGTAFRYWRGGNIDDGPMWLDWKAELTELGYTFDASTSKIVGGKGATTPESPESPEVDLGGKTADELEKQLREGIR